MDERRLPGGRARVPREAESAIRRELTEPVRRALLGFGAAGAWLVALVFILVGDGVEASGTGAAWLVLAYAHQAAWVLLAMALTWAVIRRSWGRASSVFAVSALVLYVAFVLVLLSGSSG